MQLLLKLHLPPLHFLSLSSPSSLPSLSPSLFLSFSLYSISILSPPSHSLPLAFSPLSLISLPISLPSLYPLSLISLSPLFPLSITLSPFLPSLSPHLSTLSPSLYLPLSSLSLLFQSMSLYGISIYLSSPFPISSSLSLM